LFCLLFSRSFAHLIGLSSFARFCCWHRGTDDLVAGSHALEPSHWLSRREALEKFPMLRHAGLKGATVYYDGQMNDSRVCVAVAQTAIAHGAACVNHTEVVRLLHRTEPVPSSPSSSSSSSSGSDLAPGGAATRQVVCGARVRDQLTGEEWDVRARHVVNACGPFADGVRRMDAEAANAASATVSGTAANGLVASAPASAGQSAAVAPLIAPSAGVHILLSNRFSPAGMGLIAPSSDGRVLFLLPWHGSTIAGTTDSSSKITALPRPHEAEIEFILREIRKFLEVNVKREDVDAAWSGLRVCASSYGPS
jgi:glycerol-3-phosphate dehydrogenase